MDKLFYLGQILKKYPNCYEKTNIGYVLTHKISDLPSFFYFNSILSNSNVINMNKKIQIYPVKKTKKYTIFIQEGEEISYFMIYGFGKEFCMLEYLNDKKIININFYKINKERIEENNFNENNLFYNLKIKKMYKKINIMENFIKNESKFKLRFLLKSEKISHKSNSLKLSMEFKKRRIKNEKC